MKYLQLIAVVAALNTIIASSQAQAQPLFSAPGLGAETHVHSARNVDARKVQIDHLIAHARVDISERLSEGLISPGQASAMSARLNTIISLKNQYASTGGLSAAEFERLQSRLNNVRVAVSEGTQFY